MPAFQFGLRLCRASIFIRFSYFRHQLLIPMRLNVEQEAVKEMDAETIAANIIPRLREKRGGNCPPIHVTIDPAFAKIPRMEINFEVLLEKFLADLLDRSGPIGRIRIGIHEKRSAPDLEKFLKFSPLHWSHLNIKCQSVSGIEDSIQRLLQELGCQCREWVGVKGSESQLGAFYFQGRETPALVIFIQNHGSRRSCDFLIPVSDSVSCFAHAV